MEAVIYSFRPIGVPSGLFLIGGDPEIGLEQESTDQRLASEGVSCERSRTCFTFRFIFITRPTAPATPE